MLLCPFLGFVAMTERPGSPGYEPGRSHQPPTEYVRYQPTEAAEPRQPPTFAAPPSPPPPKESSSPAGCVAARLGAVQRSETGLSARSSVVKAGFHSVRRVWSMRAAVLVVPVRLKSRSSFL